ncbi:unnamed protein product [Notodromas monacha]|uniref:Peptidase S54 rhomboid domain-containing protein n=1 Tax=Notodromas monacha TaxID=399045 RepID=A0A7R9C2Q6_9CRUS|nr:unnamed protein product [Notodromas monacha]CAG0925061.1 unnamed protein product [Notodromas monacha]
MATVLSQYSATGFHRATVSKALLGGIFLSSTAVNVPWSSHLQKYLFCDSSDVILRGQVWKLLVSRLAFPNAKEIFCVAILIYYFRIFERRFGSQKFASFLLITSTISTIMELFTVHAVKTVLPDLSDKIGSLPPGPYSLVFPLFVYFWYDVPKGAGTHLVGIPITAKTFTYLLGFQVVGTSVNSAIGAFCGIMAGLLYKFDVLGMKSKFKIPKSLGDLFSATVAKLIESSPPSASSIPVGSLEFVGEF